MKVRDPQDTLLALAVLVYAAYLTWVGVDFAEVIGTTVVGGILVLLRPGTKEY
jgi:hypothetical protein